MIKNKFYFVRHAETLWNQKKLCQGQRNIPLCPKGYEDAKLLADHLREFPVNCIVSSPLSRALDTAKEIHNQHPNAKFYTVQELSERSWGDLEGISSHEMYNIEKLEERDPNYTVGKNVEKRDEFRKRIHQGITIAQSYHPHPIIVSHGRVFLEMCFILGIPPLRQVPNCRLIEISQNSKGWHLTFL